MLSQISEQLSSFSNAERKVAECVLSEPKWFVHAAVAEIAECAHVSQPTVIRFCRSMKFKGLPEFKLALSASISHSGLAFVHEELNTDDSMGDVMEKVLGNTAAALRAPHAQRRRIGQGDCHADARTAYRVLRRGQFGHCRPRRAA